MKVKLNLNEISKRQMSSVKGGNKPKPTVTVGCICSGTEAAMNATANN